MAKIRVSIIVCGVVLAAAILVYVFLSGPHGKIIARLQQKDSSGFMHSVTVRQFGGRFNTELSEEGRPVRDLSVSSYEFYEGSYPITAATITWPELHKFSVNFDNGEIVDCSWGESNIVWAMHYAAPK